VRLPCAAAALLALAACQCSSTCREGTCYGCCDRAGFCRDGLQVTQCGQGGVSCEVCAPGSSCVAGACTPTRVEADGGRCAQTVCLRGTACDESDGVCRCNGTTCGADEFCDAGTCERGPQDGGPVPCNPVTCRGCCLTPDTCHPGMSASACGFNGNVCQPCPPPGFCVNGFCSGLPPDGGVCPGPGCNGCCQGLSCQPGGNLSFACGSFGRPCQNCGAGRCQFMPDAGFQCVFCDASSCPNGCCSGGFCVQPQSDGFCGRFGATCSNCGAGRCDVDAGLCVQTCAVSCGGCCLDGLCVPTAQQDGGACGIFGLPCRSCGPVASCVAGICTNPDGGSCSSMSCPGCCEGAECRQAQSDLTCGVNGRACESCDAGTTCQFGACNRVVGDGGLCGPSTCFGGCCSGGACGTGSGSLFCGTGGVACASCDVLGGQACDFDRVCRGIGVGAACGPTGCSSGLFCRGGEYVDGYCTVSCESMTCPGGTTCRPYDGGLECRRLCGLFGPCRPGYQCVGGDAGFCEPL